MDILLALGLLATGETQPRAFTSADPATLRPVIRKLVANIKAV